MLTVLYHIWGALSSLAASSLNQACVQRTAWLWMLALRCNVDELKEPKAVTQIPPLAMVTRHTTEREHRKRSRGHILAASQGALLIGVRAGVRAMGPLSPHLPFACNVCSACAPNSELPEAAPDTHKEDFR
eukprot:2143662-Amphidinium_carterae.1